MILYHHPFSTNSYRVRLMMSLLGMTYEEKVIDLLRGEQFSPEFKALNPAAQVPLLVDGDAVIADSHAICLYLLERHGGEEARSWWPDEPLRRARICTWLMFTANELHNSIGLARNHYAFGIPLDGIAAVARAEKALGVMDEVLTGSDWLEGQAPSLADIACYPFVAVASEGRVNLDPFGAVSTWAEKIEELTGFIPMPKLPG